MLPQISDMDSLRQAWKRYPFQLFIFALSISFFLMFVSSNPINSQIEETHAVDEMDIDEIVLSPGLAEDSSCKSYEFQPVGTDPAFFYYVDDVLNPYKSSILVELIDAQTGDVVKVRENEKQKPRQSWKSKVEQENFRVFENWTYRPINLHDIYRLRLKIGGQTCFSEKFQIKQ